MRNKRNAKVKMLEYRLQTTTGQVAKLERLSGFSVEKLYNMDYDSLYCLSALIGINYEEIPATNMTSI